MNNYYGKAFATLLLGAVLTSTTYAGFMPTPVTPPPPQANGEIQFPGEPSTTAPREMRPGAAGEIHIDLTEIALSVLQGILVPF